MDKKDRIWLKLMAIGRWFGCHQMHSRSFFIAGYQFPLCARCFGVLVGQIVGIVTICLGYRLSYIFMIIFIAIMGVDWLLQHLKILASTNIRRLITGILCGFGTTYLYFYLIVFLINFIKNILY